MNKLLSVLILALLTIWGTPARAACAVGQTVPTTTGVVGTQSHTRYISGIVKHPTQAYSLTVSWALGGVHQGSGTISFGSTSGIVVLDGTSCQSTTCTNGWASTGDTDRIFSFRTVNTYSSGGPSTMLSRWEANGVAILELYGVWDSGTVTRNWATGMSKVRSDGGTNSWLRFDGYDGVNGLITSNAHIGNDCGWW